MSIRKHRRSWQVRLPSEKAKSFPSRQAAELYEHHRKLARSLGDLHVEPPITVDEMLEGCLYRWRVRESPAEGTLRRAEQSCALWQRELGTRHLSQLSVVEVEDLIIDRANEHPNSAKKELEWFKRGLRDAQRRGQRFDLALLLIDPIRVVSRTGIALDLGQLQRLGSWFPEQLARMPEIGGSTGMRLGEMLSLEKDRVSVKRGDAWIFIPAALCKERRDKRIELAEFERELMGEHLLALPAGQSTSVFPRPGGGRHRPGPYSNRNGFFYEKVWQPARDAAAAEWRDDHALSAWDPTPFDELVPHDLRHTAISLMAAGGMRPETIAVRVGHKDGGRLILERYRHLFPEELGIHLSRYDEFVRARRVSRREAVEVGS